MRYCDRVLYTVNSEFQDDVGNAGPGLGKTQTCGRVKLVNGIPIFALLVTDFQKQYIYKITIQNLQA